MRRLSATAALATTLVLSACYPPVTSHPVGTTVGAKVDPAVVGVWRAPGDKEHRPTYLHILPRLDGPMAVIMVEGGPQPDGDWNEIAVTTARFGAYGFMNVRLISANGKPVDDQPGGTIPVLYRFDAKGDLMLCLPDEDATKAAIKAGKIKGTVTDNGKGDATITADGAALDRFLTSRAGQALYNKPFSIFTRVE
jgi:hypothetical protein